MIRVTRASIKDQNQMKISSKPPKKQIIKRKLKPGLPHIREEILSAYRAQQYTSCIGMIEDIINSPSEDDNHQYKILEAACWTMLGSKFGDSHAALDEVLVEKQDSFALYGKGVTFYFDNKFDASIKMLNRAIAENPSAEMDRAREMKLRVKAAKEALMNPEPKDDEIEEATQESTVTSSNEVHERFAAAMKLYNYAYLDKAQKAFDEILKTNPDHEDAEDMSDKTHEFIDLMDVAQTNMEHQNYEIVVEIMNQALEVDPGNDLVNASLYFQRGLAYYRMGKEQQSLDDYARFEKLDEEALKRCCQ